ENDLREIVLTCSGRSPANRSTPELVGGSPHPERRISHASSNRRIRGRPTSLFRSPSPHALAGPAPPTAAGTAPAASGPASSTAGPRARNRLAAHSSTSSTTEYMTGTRTRVRSVAKESPAITAIAIGPHQAACSP